MAKHLTLEEKLYQRKIKTPNRFVYFVFRIICHFLKRKYHAEIIIENSIPKKGPFFLIFNHQSRLDYIWPILAAKGRRLNFLAAYNEYFRKKFWKMFKLDNAIPKKNFVLDLAALKNIKSIIDQGGCICFSPEGRNSYYGTNSPILNDTGKFLKQFNIPVYLVKIHGSYLTSLKHTNEIRVGKIIVTLSKLDLSSVPVESLDDYLNEKLRFDDYAWQKEQQIQWPSKTGIAERLHYVMYKCPKCGHEFSMVSKENIVKCQNCGNGVKVDSYYHMEPLNKSDLFFSSPSEWAKYERKEIIKHIRRDAKFQHIEEVTIGMLPKYKLLKGDNLSETVGNGSFIINHQGVILNGTKNNKPFSITFNYNEIYTIGMWPMMNTCFFYYGDELYSITPNRPSALKLNMLVEEMHRLHVNNWKNFTWEQYLYPTKKKKTR